MADSDSDETPSIAPSESYTARSNYSLNRGNSVASAICGREVFEPRERFTLYKIEVNNGERTWVVYRRFSDFVLLNKKLKKLFPRFQLNLPPKRFFKDNFNTSFIKKRQIGLEEFMGHLFSLKDVMDTRPVQQFFRLDNPPGPDEDLTASRNYCTSLEKSVKDLKRDLQEQDYELSHLRSELARAQFNDGNPAMAFKSQVESSFTEKVLQQKLLEAEDTARRAVQEVDRLKVEIQAERAQELSKRNSEKQQRELQLKDFMKAFNAKQQIENERLREMVGCFGDSAKVNVQINGRSIEVKTVEGVMEKEVEIKTALQESRQALEDLYKGYMESYQKEIEDIKTDLVKTEYQLQTSRTELQNMKDALSEVHRNKYEEIITRDKVIYEYQQRLEEAKCYSANSEQKYFYSLILGVKLNMALWGKANIAINRLKPALLFEKVRDQGISIEHWPSWVSRELATLADIV